MLRSTYSSRAISVISELSRVLDAPLIRRDSESDSCTSAGYAYETDRPHSAEKALKSQENRIPPAEAALPGAALPLIASDALAKGAPQIFPHAPCRLLVIDLYHKQKITSMDETLSAIDTPRRPKGCSL